MVLVGNKADLAKARAVPVDLASTFADSIGANFYEVSAKDGEGLI